MEYESSGTFTVLPSRQRGLLSEHGLREPGEWILLAVQGAVESGAEAIAFRLSAGKAQLLLRGNAFDPEQLPESLQRALDTWTEPTARWERSGPVWSLTTLRAVKPAQLGREGEILQRHCHFCPVPVKLDGYIVQPHHWFHKPARASKLIRHDYHLAEWFWSPAGGQPGIAVFRADANVSTLPRPNTEHTFWRELEPGVHRLAWSMPWRVGSQIARLRPGFGLRAEAALILRPETGQSSFAVPVHRGVAIGRWELDWPELPGLCLVFDASRFATDLSGLQLVDSLTLRAWFEAQRQRVRAWVCERLPSWSVEVKHTGATARQTRKEIGAWLSVFAATLLSGWGAFVPLPFLALPWIIWHHGTRKQIVELWNSRLAELAATKDQSFADEELSEKAEGN
jgi:hypothetical protein